MSCGNVVTKNEMNCLRLFGHHSMKSMVFTNISAYWHLAYHHGRDLGISKYQQRPLDFYQVDQIALTASGI